MENKKQIRGSEWNMWDLHIHTPSSIAASEYGGNNEEVWSKFFEELEHLPREFKVLGINDYLFLDGYERVLEYKNKGGLVNIDLVLPVIELRIKEFVGSKDLNRINYHIIFADESQLDLNVIKSHFLSGLTGKACLNSEFSNYPSWQGVVTKESLIDFGKHIYDTTPTDSKPNKNYLEIGFNNINFELSKVKSLLGEDSEPNTYLKNKYFKVIGKAEWEDFRWTGSPSEKKTLINDAHFVFSASPTIADANKGRDILRKQGVNNRLLHCSDAHKFPEDRLDTKPKDLGHCFTWIKGETSFEGLKQVLYESDSRLAIQENSPNTKRLDKVIKSVSFVNHNDFTGDKIYLNPDLNTVIGGKSSGKSLLLYYIANTIDWKYSQQQYYLERKQQQIDEYNFSNEESFDFIVEWEDGVIYNYKDNTTTKNRQFVYIPQSYIINLTSNIEKSSRKELGKFIRAILLQESSSNNEYNQFISRVKKLDTDRNSSIDSFFRIQDEIDTKYKEIKDIGDVLGINNQIQNLREQIEKLKLGTSNKTELERYNILSTRIQKVDKLQSLAELHNSVLNDLISFMELTGKDLLTKYSNITELVTLKETKNLLMKISQFIEGYKTNVDGIREENVLIYNKCSIKINSIRDNLNSQLKPIQEKLKHGEQIKSIQEELNKELKKVGLIKSIESKIKELKERLKVTKEALFQQYTDAYLEYDKIIKTLNSRAIHIEDVKLKGSIKFHENRFLDEMWGMLNQRSNKVLQDYNILKYPENSKLENVNFEEHLQQKKDIFDLLAGDKVLFKNYKTKKDCAYLLFKDLFFDYWELIIGEDEMANMSPGKANLAVLKLLIELSESDCPILIDQPEDNLDNRSIYSDLVKFIRGRKSNRQLIIVTHNPNIVVGADSENIVVANQSGQDVNRENEAHRFEYINNGIENTFRDSERQGILNQMGIKEHVTEILEGGEDAFRKREKKYGLFN